MSGGSNGDEVCADARRILVARTEGKSYTCNAENDIKANENIWTPDRAESRDAQARFDRCLTPNTHRRTAVERCDTAANILARGMPNVVHFSNASE